MEIIKNGGITTPKGFKAAGIHCGIKKKKKDLAIITSDKEALCCACFTQNTVKAAPLKICEENLKTSNNQIKAIIINLMKINICDKSKSNEVKKIYEKLKDINDETHKVHKTVYRPWGYYSVLQEGEGFLTKCICVNPHAKLSLQYHFHRSEHWVVLEGNAVVVKDDIEYNLTPGESIDIKIKETHSLQNLTNKPLKILEVQKGDILDENDIVRLSDLYGRV